MIIACSIYTVADMMSSVPFTPGHEMVGEVSVTCDSETTVSHLVCCKQIVSRGEGVSDEFAPGNRVCVENHFYCGKCYQCTNGSQPGSCHLT